MRGKGYLFLTVEFQMMNIERMLQEESPFSKHNLNCCR